MKDDALEIVKVEKESHDTTSIFFTGPDMERFKARKPGQFAAIRVFQDGAWSEPHPFTLSCAPEDDTLRMTIKKSGEFTAHIQDIQPGTPIRCAGPFGQFCGDIDSQREIVMIAGGVGITPFLSVLRHFNEVGATNNIVLFWANKDFADAFAADELEEMTRTLNLHVVHAFSRVDADRRRPSPDHGDNRPGRITYEYGRLSRDVFIRHMRTADAAFYLCGPPPMQQTVLEELTSCSVDTGRVQKEAFVFQKK